MTDTSGKSIGSKNPFRYRGYCWEIETEFYYVGSRYYDPEVGRWINADGYISTGQGICGYNMYAYCNNNPANMIDSSGKLPDHMLLRNAQLYEAGANIMMCGWNNNKSKSTTSITTSISESYNNALNVAQISTEVAFDVAKYSYQNTTRPSNIGVGTHKKSIKIQIQQLNIISKYTDDFLNSLSYVGVGIAVGENIYSNVAKEQSFEKIVWDATVDTTIIGINTYTSGMVSATIGAAVGTAMGPGYGTIIGFTVGYGVDLVLSLLGDKRRGNMKSWVE